MMRISHGIGALGVVILAGSVAMAQAPAGGGQRSGQPAPPPMTNLQVIPKDTPRPQVIQTMQAFTQALGVRCEYCHVDEGPGKQDYAADTKGPKKAARGMILLAREINEKLPTAVTKSADATTRVGCVTCHRGVAIPKQLGDILTATASAQGMPAAIAQYKELRTGYFGAMAYDFSEGGLLTIASRPNTKPEDAIEWLQLNLESYPKSARTYVALATTKNAKGDKPGAIAALEKAVELDPNNARAKAQLENLKKSEG